MTATEILRGFAGFSVSEATIRLQAIGDEECLVLIEADLVDTTSTRRAWTQEGMNVLRAMRRSSHSF